MRSSPHEPASVELHLEPEPEVDRLSLHPILDSGSDVRIDAEPHWRSDPQTICFAVRISGALTATLNITHVLEKLLNCTVQCACSSPSLEVSVPRSERWQHVSLHQLHRSGIPGALKSSIFIGDKDKILLNVGGDDACRVYAAGILSCRKLVICKECTLCALNATKAKANSFSAQSTALIIG